MPAPPQPLIVGQNTQNHNQQEKNPSTRVSFKIKTSKLYMKPRTKTQTNTNTSLAPKVRIHTTTIEPSHNAAQLVIITSSDEITLW